VRSSLLAKTVLASFSDLNYISKIRLLEINPDTFATGVVQSFYFPPSDEIPYPLVLAEVTPDEWQKVLLDEIPLPEGWSITQYKEYYRDMVAA
jgi:hypothetical protein